MVHAVNRTQPSLYFPPPKLTSPVITSDLLCYLVLSLRLSHHIFYNLPTHNVQSELSSYHVVFSKSYNKKLRCNFTVPEPFTQYSHYGLPTLFFFPLARNTIFTQKMSPVTIP